MKRVKVRVIYTKREGTVLRWYCPRDRRNKQIRVQNAKRSEIKAQVAALEAEINAGLYVDRSKVTWEAFREAYELQKLDGLRASTAARANSALNAVEAILRPKLLSDVDEEGLALFYRRIKEKSRKSGGHLKKLSPATIAAHFRHIMGALRWAKRRRMISYVPDVEFASRRQRGSSPMRGRPITEEEFSRMLAHIESVRPRDAQVWRDLLTGLWLSGLRLSEALALSWDYGPVQVQQRGEFYVVVFQPEGQKSGRHEQMPATPDFAEMLNAIPQEKRIGKLFPIMNEDGRSTLVAWVGRLISRLGCLANVVVNESTGKFASAHDLRRSFGTRWASKQIPVASLKRIMRHSSIETTLKYYVSIEATELAAELKHVAD